MVNTTTYTNWFAMLRHVLLVGVVLLLLTLGSFAADIDYTPLQDHQPFIVAYSNNHSPFSDTNIKGQPEGMAINIMNYMAQKADFDVEYVTVNYAKEHDIAVDINLAILAEDQLPDCQNKSVPYGHLQMMIITRDKRIVSTGATIGHLAYSDLDEVELRTNFLGAATYTYFSYSEMARDYVSGKLDYMLVTSLVADLVMDATMEVDSYVVPSEVNLAMRLGYSDHLTEQEVVLFDRLIASLDSDHIQNLMLNAVMAISDKPLSILEIIQEYALFIILSILAVVVTIGVVIHRLNREKQNALKKQLNEDELTKMLTERKFLEEARSVLQNTKLDRWFILSIDINNFKAINEVYGYEVGSQVILRFSKMLREIFPQDTLIARFFADHFVLLYQDGEETVEVDDRKAYADRLYDTMKDLLGEDFRMTTSTGIYRVRDTDLPVPSMVDCANVARRQGKISYDTTNNLFDKDMEVSIQKKNDIVLTMEHAMETKEFQVYYQPKIDQRADCLAGAEALIRWIRPDGSMRFPDEFIPIFESNGFIVKLDMFVLEAVCDFLVANPMLPKVAINFSGVTMLRRNLIGRVERALTSRKLDPSRLEIEVTESALVNNFDIVTRQIASLKQLGLTVAMDDFGAGISSLNRLNDMDFDILKIDKAFLGRKELTPRNTAIIRQIISMAHQLDMKVVAEGVEYKSQENLLKTLSCDYTQGYLYAKPLPVEKYLEYVRNR